jgi:actin cytoskeleton-regulatory complex protein PAN1
MYSNSNSFLGGSNGARPGQPGYGQQQQQSFNQSQFPGQPQGQQQQNGFAPQQTGFGQQPLQQQFTGFPGQAPQQPQQTGFQQPQQTGFQQPQQTGFQQPQATGFQSQPAFNAGQYQQPPVPAIPQQFQQQQTQQQPPAAPQAPQPTGVTSSQMANSFRSTPAAPEPSLPKRTGGGAKIPNIRLSFVTVQDQAKFEQLFKSAAGNDQALSGKNRRHHNI